MKNKTFDHSFNIQSNSILPHIALADGKVFKADVEITIIAEEIKQLADNSNYFKEKSS